jgi:hypothetical protein
MHTDTLFPAQYPTLPHDLIFHQGHRSATPAMVTRTRTALQAAPIPPLLC